MSAMTPAAAVFSSLETNNPRDQRHGNLQKQNMGQGNSESQKIQTRAPPSGSEARFPGAGR